MSQIMQSPEVEVDKTFELLSTIHCYFANFQNKHLPMKESSLQYNTEISLSENCKVAIVKIKGTLKLIKDLIVHPDINKITSLLDLAKLTDDLKYCVDAYVELL